ncbi:MAG: signal peptidase II, partial [Terriglobia bacterium]
DFGTKAWVQASFPPHESFPIIKNVLHITHVRNTGAAFGIFPGQQAVFVVLSLLAIVFFTLFSFVRSHQSVHKLGFGLVVGGTTGNLIGRWQRGVVTDFIDIQIWPIFNLADVAIIVGAGLLIIEFVREDRRSRSDRARPMASKSDTVGVDGRARDDR